MYPWTRAVSYTHLDVYKRQMLGQERMQKIAKENEEYAKKLAEAEKKRIEEKKKYTDEMCIRDRISNMLNKVCLN